MPCGVFNCWFAVCCLGYMSPCLVPGGGGGGGGGGVVGSTPSVPACCVLAITL